MVVKGGGLCKVLGARVFLSASLTGQHQASSHKAVSFPLQPSAPGSTHEFNDGRSQHLILPNQTNAIF